ISRPCTPDNGAYETSAVPVVVIFRSFRVPARPRFGTRNVAFSVALSAVVGQYDRISPGRAGTAGSSSRPRQGGTRSRTGGDQRTGHGGTSRRPESCWSLAANG